MVPPFCRYIALDKPFNLRGKMFSATKFLIPPIWMLSASKQIIRKLLINPKFSLGKATQVQVT
jgi:hypothetical protein